MKGKSSVLMLNLLENKIVFLTSFNEIMSFEKSHPESTVRTR